jgi:hypothetical protein
MKQPVLANHHFSPSFVLTLIFYHDPFVHVFDLDFYADIFTAFSLFVSWELPLVLYFMISSLCLLHYKSRVVNKQLGDSYIKGELVVGVQYLRMRLCDKCGRFIQGVKTPILSPIVKEHACHSVDQCHWPIDGFIKAI